MYEAIHFKKSRAVKILFIVAIFLFLGTFVSFADDGGKPVAIAHGGGVIEGYETTNSIDAVMQAISNGYQLIELDMEFSRDDKIIMLHDWDRTFVHYYGSFFSQKLKKNEFEKMLVNGKFRTLTFDRLTKILDEAPDIRIVTDTKGDNIKLLTKIAEDYPDYVSRLVPQIYSYEEYDAVKELGYDDIILTLYMMMGKIEYEELLTFTREHDLYAVTICEGHTIKDLEARLAQDGVTVYFHPIYTLEEADALRSKGVHGIYTGTLLPREFEEPEHTYYLLDGTEKLIDLEIPEVSADAIKRIWIKNGVGKTIHYEIDGQALTDDRMGELANGKHALKIDITVSPDETVTLSYAIWKDDSALRLLDTKYEYRLNDIKELPDMMETLSEAGITSESSEAIIDILQNSLIVKAGAYYGYNNGNLLLFTVGEEFLYAQRYTNGTVLAPLAECIKALEADSISMDAGRYLYIYYDDVRTVIQANTFFLSQGNGYKWLKTPVMIYRSKTMASGEIFKIVTNRPYIDSEAFLIVLPEGASVTEEEEQAILEAAATLYMD